MGNLVGWMTELTVFHYYSTVQRSHSGWASYTSHCSRCDVPICKRGVLLCKKSWLKLWLKSAWNKHSYFNLTSSTMPIFVIEILTNFDWNSQKLIIERSWLFQCNRFHYAENRQSQSLFFWELSGAHEYLCRAHSVHDVITRTL